VGLRHTVPHFWVHVIVFFLSLLAVIFLMYKNQPTMVGLEEPNAVRLQKDERKD